MSVVDRRQSEGTAQVPPRQQRFVDEYAVDLNASAAYRRAGYRAKGAAVRANASRLLANANVQAAIAVARRDRAERTSLEADDVIRELGRVAFSDITEFVEWGPEGVELKPCPQIDADATSAVRSARRARNGSVTVTMHDKIGALEQLMQHLGLFGPVSSPLKNAPS